MGRNKYLDMRGVLIQPEDYIAYGKSDRNHPIKLGEVVCILDDGIEVLGKGNTKVGKIPASHLNRVLVLPDDYREF